MQNKLSLKWTGISCCHKVCKRGVRQICKKGCFSRCFWRQDGSSHHFLFIAGENWWPIFLKGRRQEVRSWQISVLFSFPSWQQHKGFFVSDRFAKGQLITWFFIRTARVISKTHFFHHEPVRVHFIEKRMEAYDLITRASARRGSREFSFLHFGFVFILDNGDWKVCALYCFCLAE